MARQWMPLYVDDYLADTRRLSTLEHGAYILLIMEYWHHGSLPQDTAQLARIAGLTIAEWQAIEPNVAALFLPGWKHKRVEKELAEAQAAYDRRAAAGQKGGHAKAERQKESIAPSNAAAMPQQEDVALLPQAQPLSQQLSSLRSDSAAARAAELKIGITAAFREAQSTTINPQTHRADIWLAQGYDPAICLAAIRSVLADKPHVRDLKYFDGPIADAHTVPRGTPKSTGPPRAGKSDPYLKHVREKLERANHERDNDPTIIDSTCVASQSPVGSGVHAVGDRAGGPRLADTG